VIRALGLMAGAGLPPLPSPLRLSGLPGAPPWAICPNSACDLLLVILSRQHEANIRLGLHQKWQEVRLRGLKPEFSVIVALQP
jgi:hypothetical protein